jgi:hypothetical protein
MMKSSADQYFAIIPESVLYADISSHAIRVYGILRRHADKDDGTCYPGRATLSRLGHMSVRTVDKAIEELVALGALKVRHRHDPKHPERMLSNEYTLLTPVHILHHPPANPAPPPCTDCTGTKAIELEPRNQRNIRSTDVDPVFDTFWHNYPRKVGRKKALQWWQRHGNQQILDSLNAWRQYWVQEGTDMRYIPHPYTWLNQERWRDPAPEPAGNQRTDTVLAVLNDILNTQPALEAHNDPF